MDDALWDEVKRDAERHGQSISSVVTAALGQYFRSKIVRSSSWETDEDEGWYDPKKFYTYSQDKYGHSAKVEIPIPKMVAGEVAGIVQSGRIPELRTPADFYRNAVRHEAYRVGKMLEEDELVRVARLMTIHDRTMSIQAAATEFNELIIRMSDVLDEEILNGNHIFARQLLDEYWDFLSTIDERFKDRFEDLLRTYEDNLAAVKARDEKIGSRKGTINLPDGRRFKNGIELAPVQRRKRKPDQELD